MRRLIVICALIPLVPGITFGTTIVVNETMPDPYVINHGDSLTLPIDLSWDTRDMFNPDSWGAWYIDYAEWSISLWAGGVEILYGQRVPFYSPSLFGQQSIETTLSYDTLVQKLNLSPAQTYEGELELGVIANIGIRVKYDALDPWNTIHIPGSFYDTISTLQIVPEPATVLLLGIGGLLIRKRRV